MICLSAIAVGQATPKLRGVFTVKFRMLELADLSWAYGSADHPPISAGLV